MMYASLQGFIFLVIVCSTWAAEWSYEGEHGPEHWKDTFIDCAGEKQSPIDIKPSSAKKDQIPRIALDKYDNKLITYNVKNNGHTVQVTLSQSDIKIKDGALDGEYTLGQFHMHWGKDNCHGSEHTVDGHHYPLEIHFVHYKSVYGNINEAVKREGGLAVLGVFADIGEQPHKTIEQLTQQFASIKYKDTSFDGNVSNNVVLSNLLPSNPNEFVRYNGSLTTPGCNEVVIWTVFNKPITVSATQMNAFRALSLSTKASGFDKPMDINYRPVMPLGDRNVLKTYGDGANHPSVKTTCGATSICGNGHGLVYAFPLMVWFILKAANKN